VWRRPAFLRFWSVILLAPGFPEHRTTAGLLTITNPERHIVYGDTAVIAPLLAESTVSGSISND
jgi:hypothetical protein